jgi:hypothetical protein
MSKSTANTMLISFFTIRGIIHFEFVPKRTPVNQTFHMEVLKRLTDAMRCILGELWRDNSVIHHNMLAHSLLQSVTVFSRKRHLCHGSSTILSLLGSS